MQTDDIVRFVFFSVLGVAALAGGYLSRRRGWVDERHSRRVHFHTVTWAWSGAALVAIWRLPMEMRNVWVAVIQTAVIVGPALLIIPFARLACRRIRGQVGVMSVAAGVGNIGWTMGGYICFILIDPPGEALAFAGTAAAVLAVVIVLALYPIANHYGQLTGGVTLGRLMLRSLTMLPAMPLYLGVVGLILAATVPFPEWLIDYYVVDIILLAVNVGGYLGVGMRLRLGDGAAYWRQHLLLGVFAFGVTPAITAALILFAGLTPQPMSGVAARVMVVEAFMPTGVSCIILANIFHLDTRLAASLWLWNTVFFLVLPLPILIWALA